MLTPSSEKLQRKLNIKEYLDELSLLLGRPVHDDELGSLEQAASLRKAAQSASLKPSRVFQIPFSDKSSERFKGFVQRLHTANNSGVYIWTPRTAICGALLVPTLTSINFEFDFRVNKEGILAFSSGDLKDSMLLDFSIELTGGQVLKVELQGDDWPNVVY